MRIEFHHYELEIDYIMEWPLELPHVGDSIFFKSSNGDCLDVTVKARYFTPCSKVPYLIDLTISPSSIDNYERDEYETWVMSCFKHTDLALNSQITPQDDTDE